VDPGAKRARDLAIVEHYPMVRAIAGRIARRLPASVDVEELVSVGTLGLIDAFDRFDASRAVPFRAYAEIRIRGAIMDSLREGDWTPRTARRAAHDIEDAKTRLRKRLGREPEREEIAAELALQPGAYDKMRTRAAGRRVVSLDGPVSEDGDASLGDTVATEGASALDQWIDAEEYKRLGGAVGLLPEREQTIVTGYYQRGQSLKEIGAMLGVTESRVCQLHGRAVQRLRTLLAPETE